MTDIIIIGAGFAGLTAGIYAVRAGLKCIVFEKEIHGGQVSITSYVENYPGISKISGAELSNNLYQHALNQGVEIKYEQILSCDLKSDIKVIETSTGKYSAAAVIIANGVSRRKLNCEGENEFSARGVSYCATCDGAFYKSKVTAIIGGGNTALEDALFLSNLCKKVYLIHRRDSFRAEKALSDAVSKRNNIEVLYDTIVQKISGDKLVSGITVKNIKDNQVKNLPVDGVFIAVGLEPLNNIFKGQIELDDNGYIVSDENCKTSLNGVFVAGDTRTKLLRQIVTAASDGAVAAFQASQYINTNIDKI